MMTMKPAAVLAGLADHPVTNAEYAAFVAAGGDPDWEPFWPEHDAPAVRVSYHDARTYCAWAGVRLPTDAEWQTWMDALPPDDPRRLVDDRSVWEWTASAWGGEPDTPAARRVVRGGSWHNACLNARAAYRFGHYPDYRNLNVGFRVVRGRHDDN